MSLAETHINVLRPHSAQRSESKEESHTTFQIVHVSEDHTSGRIGFRNTHLVKGLLEASMFIINSACTDV